MNNPTDAVATDLEPKRYGPNDEPPAVVVKALGDCVFEAERPAPPPTDPPWTLERTQAFEKVLARARRRWEMWVDYRCYDNETHRMGLFSAFLIDAVDLFNQGFVGAEADTWKVAIRKGIAAAAVSIQEPPPLVYNPES